MRALWGIVACFAIAGVALLSAYFYAADRAANAQHRKKKEDASGQDGKPALTVRDPREDHGGDGGGGNGGKGDPPAPLTGQHGDPMTTVYCGKANDPLTLKPLPIQAVLTTRRRDATYQALVRYAPQHVQSADLPGLQDIQRALAVQGQTLPAEVGRIDQETEMFIDCLGQPLHSIMTYTAYVNPSDGKVVAYELAQSSGGQAERMVGHLTPKGALVDIYRGSQRVDSNEVTFPNSRTWIPVEMELIPQWYQTHAEQLTRREPVLFSLFMPEVMGFILLKAKPIDDEVVAIGDMTHECQRFEVWTSSLQSSEGQQAHQIMWFNKRADSGVLMRIQDIDPTLKIGEGPVTERGDVGSLAHLRQSTEPVPRLPARAFPYPLDKTLLYTVNAKNDEIGRVRIKYEKAKGGGYTATATVDVGSALLKRHETSTTQFSADWETVRYTASGQDSGEAVTDYLVDATISGEKLGIAMQRNTVPPKIVRKPEVEEKADESSVNKDLFPSGRNPLPSVPIADEDATAAEEPDIKPVSVRQQLERPLTKGSFLFDHNRLEQLAALACRLPLPTLKPGDPAVLYQKAGIYFVRQNRAGIVLFEIGPEPKPVLTERQKQRQLDSDEPQLYVASAASAMMPCRMLLTAEGRILELKQMLGASDITFTLDDPIMRRRAERAKREKLKQGPRLLRPDWW